LLRRYAPLTRSSQDQTPQLWERRPLRSDAASVVVRTTDWEVPEIGLLGQPELRCYFKSRERAYGALNPP